MKIYHISQMSGGNINFEEANNAIDQIRQAINQIIAAGSVLGNSGINIDVMQVVSDSISNQNTQSLDQLTQQIKGFNAALTPMKT
jgi:hypothetical protein